MVPLFQSPVQRWDDVLFREKRIDVFIKRDDMLHPFISGNKWRKLRYPLQDAAGRGATRLVTFGGAWSNHLVATACAAAASGLTSTGFVRGEKLTNLALSLCSTFGMELVFCSREAYRDKRALFDARFGNDDSAYFIDEGGAGPLAAKGCAELVAELPDTYDHMFCAAGTGTTAAGLANGILDNGRQTQLHVVPVLRNAGLQFPEHAIVHAAYHFGGYARTDEALIRFIQAFAAATGILADPVYTGKLCYAVKDLAARNYFGENERVLVVHSGGAIGYAGKIAEFSVK